jgi:hypothetical protein
MADARFFRFKTRFSKKIFHNCTNCGTGSFLLYNKKEVRYLYAGLLFLPLNITVIQGPYAKFC